jgi:uncharacterized phage protein gp47/JayE
MPLYAETEEKIFGDLLFDIVENTNITRTSPGSKTRAIAKALSKKLGRMWTQFDVNMVQSYLSGAEGKFLDYIGNMMGVERLGESTASISSADQIVKFYTDIGTFGDINGASSISISAGTIISTQKNGTGVRYIVPFTVVLPSDQDTFYIPVESIISGSNANVGAKTLIYHDFTSYTDVLNNTLKITNESEIANGRFVENDTNYRFRIANQVLASERANDTAVRLASLIVPGVSDAVVLPFARGIGTYDVLIKATTPKVPTTLISAVQESVNAVSALGIVPLVRKPREIGVSLVGTLTLKRKVSSADEASIIQAATDNVINYINNLDIGEELIVNEIVERVLSTSDVIKNIGVTGKPLDSLYIHKPSKLEDSKTRETLITDYAPEYDEKLFVEDQYAGSTPILFRVSF